MPVGETERPINLQFDLLAPRRNPPVGEVTDVPYGYVSSDPTSRDIIFQLNSVIGFMPEKLPTCFYVVALRRSVRRSCH